MKIDSTGVKINSGIRAPKLDLAESQLTLVEAPALAVLEQTRRGKGALNDLQKSSRSQNMAMSWLIGTSG
jgi:hypothetical protein